MAPLSRIQATAADVSRPPEKAMPTRSPTGSDVKTLLTGGEATATPRSFCAVRIGPIGPSPEGQDGRRPLKLATDTSAPAPAMASST